MKKIIIISAFTIFLILFLSWITGNLIEKLLPAQAESGKNVVELVSSIGWLIFAIVGLLALFQPFSNFLEGISGRITKVTVFDVSIEVAELSEFKPTWLTDVGDFRKITPQYVFDSASQTLFQEITEKTLADYAVIDLGDGKQWLTSRLYLFSIMLERMRGLKAFVFVAPVNTYLKCYIGTATTNEIRWSLAQKYPWLENSFANAYSQMISQPYHLQNFLKQERMSKELAVGVARQFLEGIQQTNAPTENREQWVELQSPLLWENAEWIGLPLLQSILGNSLYTGKVNYSPLESRQQQVKNIAAFDEPLIALTKSNGIFHSLVDRQALLEEIALSALTSLSDSQAKVP